MIREQDLDEAIANCQGVMNPTSNTCLKLASYYTIKDHMFKREEPVNTGYSMSNGNAVYIPSESEFAEKVNGRDVSDVMQVMDELMTTLSVINPRLYNGVMNKL